MALSLLIYSSDALWATSGALPPAVPQLIRSLQAADAEEMTKLVAQMLAEMVVLNAAIVAANPEYPDPDTLQLGIIDADLAGGGDGHTFVLTVTFLPLVSKSGLPLPEEVVYGFVTGSTAETIETLLSEKIQATANQAPDAENSPLIVFWQAVRGAAKGTRFMAGFAGQPAPQE
jgi:hypothetical protein